MKKFITLFFSALLVTGSSMLSSCDNDTDDNAKISSPIPITLTTVQSRALTQSTDFGFKIFKQLCKEEKNQDQNIFFSPLSSSICLSMICNAANGLTRDEIMNFMELSNDSELENLNRVNSQLLDVIPVTDPQTEVGILNSLWIDNTIFTVNNDFINSMKEIYSTEVFIEPIRNANGVKRINQWASNKTKGLIPKIIYSETDFAFINALYFNGIWTDKFFNSSTKKEEFVKEDGSKTRVEMMNREANMPYAENEHFRITSKSFGNGAFKMYFLLPLDDKLSTSLNSLTADTWKEIRDDMQGKKLDFKLPKFRIEADYDMISVLKDLGIKTLFENNADLSNMLIDSDSDQITLFTQKSYIDIQEDGVEAAAVTVAGSMSTSNGFHDTNKFYLNRPFFFMIAESSTEAILFAGKIGTF